MLKHHGAEKKVSRCAEKEQQSEIVHTESLVRVNCSRGIISSPVSSDFLGFVGAMVGNGYATWAVLCD
jgi:hypothetical protein